jgi:hypothetical protein
VTLLTTTNLALSLMLDAAAAHARMNEGDVPASVLNAINSLRHVVGLPDLEQFPPGIDIASGQGSSNFRKTIASKLSSGCGNCHKCMNLNGPWLPTKMLLCPFCGNKRCPKASNHELSCTESNEPGQPDSIHGPVWN